MIPSAIETAPGPVAEAAKRHNDLHAEARRARQEQRNLEREIALAERADLRAEGEAVAAGTSKPKLTAPALRERLEDVTRKADVAEQAALAGTRLFGETLVGQTDAWLGALATEHADATTALHAALAQAAAAAARIQDVRSARGWVGAAITEFSSPNGHGRIPTIAPHGSVPPVQLGASIVRRRCRARRARALGRGSHRRRHRQR